MGVNKINYGGITCPAWLQLLYVTLQHGFNCCVLPVQHGFNCCMLPSSIASIAVLPVQHGFNCCMLPSSIASIAVLPVQHGFNCCMLPCSGLASFFKFIDKAVLRKHATVSLLYKPQNKLPPLATSATYRLK